MSNWFTISWAVTRPLYCFLSCLMVTKTQAAMVLGKYMQELKVWAQGEVEAASSQKARFLTGGSESSICKRCLAVWAGISTASAMLAVSLSVGVGVTGSE